jgi:hypothetical protein
MASKFRKMQKRLRKRTRARARRDWEARIDLRDGSGIQVFKGKTRKKVIAAIIKAQENATRKIWQREKKHNELIAEQAPWSINAAAILGAFNHRFEKLLEPKSPREVLVGALASKS